MRHTLNAVFDKRSDAQHVLEELLASGYASADTALSSVPPIGQADDAAGLGASIKHSAARLFGAQHRKRKEEDSSSSLRERHIVTLTTESEPEAERAVGIIQRFGPVGIEDLHDELDQANADADRPRVTACAGETRRRYSPGTEPGALQNRAHEDSRYFGTQNAASPPTGNTFEEIMGAASQLPNPDLGRTGAGRPDVDDDSYYRSHWIASYANSGDDRNYEDHAPAYLYGSEAKRGQKYRSRDWSDAEPDLKADWESRESGQLMAWEDFRDAVHHGWNKIGPGMDDETLAYRSHQTGSAADTGIHDDDLAQAYLHGSDAARDSKHAGHHWKDVEARLKREWERRHAGGGPSTWDKVKAAVRHGWERVKS